MLEVMVLSSVVKQKVNLFKEYLMKHDHKIKHEHVEHHLKEHDGGMHGHKHEHEKIEEHLKKHDGGMHGHMHEHEKVEKMCGGGYAKK